MVVVNVFELAEPIYKRLQVLVKLLGLAAYQIDVALIVYYVDFLTQLIECLIQGHKAIHWIPDTNEIFNLIQLHGELRVLLKLLFLEIRLFETACRREGRIVYQFNLIFHCNLICDVAILKQRDLLS